jgi:hypothetical protein
MSHEEEDTCMSYEEEDTCMSYEEENTSAACHMRRRIHACPRTLERWIDAPCILAYRRRIHYHYT